MKSLMICAMALVVMVMVSSEVLAEWTWEKLEERPFEGKIIDILIDDNDVLWVSTEYEGLYSYNGETWKKYGTDDGIYGSQTGDFTLTPDGIVWVITDSGLFSYDGTVWTQHRFPGRLIQFGGFRGKSTMVVSDDSGSIWIGAYARFAKYYDGNWTVYVRADGFVDNKIDVNAFSIDSKGNGCVSFYYPNPDPDIQIMSKATYAYVDNSWVETYIQDYMGHEKKYNVGFSQLTCGPDGFVWGCIDDDIYSLNGNKWEIVLSNYFENVRDLVTGPNGKVWVTSSKNVSYFDGVKWNAYGYSDNESNNAQLVSTNSDGTVWVASEYNLSHLKKIDSTNNSGGTDIPVDTPVNSEMVVINEFMSSNSLTIKDENGDFPDWIELYNSGDEAVDLAGYGLSDRDNNPFKWTFPATIIEPHAYLIIFASGKDILNSDELHTNFKISSDGETIVLTSPGGETADLVPAHEIPADLSWGRLPDVSDSWALFDKPSPGTANHNEGFTSFAGEVEFSKSGGIYSGAVQIELSVDSADAIIRYTLDGSEPTSESTAYGTPIILEKTTVIRARIFENGKLPGQIITHSYLIDENTTLPIVSLSTDPANLFDETTGIYMHGNDPGEEWLYPGANFWKDWERPLHIEMFEPDGSLGFSIDAGVKMNGEVNRLFPQKSFSIYARKRYGYSSIKHKIFPNLPIDEFKSIILRNSGNDLMKTMIRDGLCQGLFADRDVDVQAHRPAIVFINGEYYGIHNIRERKNEDVIASHHNIDPDEVEILETSATLWNTDMTDDKFVAVEGDDEHYQAMMSFIENNDVSYSNNYEYIRTQMDVDNFIETCVAHLFLGDEDWPARNTRLWRPRKENGKWRWMLFDLDVGMGSYSEGDIITWIFNTKGYHSGMANPPWSTFLLRRLLGNEHFKNAFINRFADCMNTMLIPDNVNQRIDSMVEAIEAEIPRHIDTWTQKIADSDYYSYRLSSKENWHENIQVLRDFASERPYYMRQHLKNYFGLKDTLLVTIDSPYDGGMIHLNSLDLDTFPWSGSYFTDMPITVTAQPNLGYRFIGWEGVSSSTEPSIELTLTNDTELTAVFEKTGNDIVIGISQSPFEVTSDLVISPEMTLTVDAGVELLMAEDTSIIVQGKLTVNGTSDNPVTIHSTSSQRWGAIVFDNAGAASTISHAIIRGASHGKDAIAFPAAVSGFNSDFTMTSVVFEENIQGIFAKGGNLTVKNCVFESSNSDEPINIAEGWALVEGCRFYDVQAQDAIDFDGVRGGIIRNNEIYGSNDDGIDIGDGCSDILITGNHVSGCFDKAISIGEVSKDIRVERNILTNSSYGVAVKDNSTAVIDHTTFYGNDIAIAGYEKGIDASGGGQATVTNSILAGSKTSALMTDDLSAITVTFSLADKELLPGEGNLHGDPLFQAPDHGGFMLTADSPAIDSGDPESAADPDGSPTDMGALAYRLIEATVVITEINYNPSPDFDTEDWIEIYNSSDTAIDLSGYRFRDESDENVFAIPEGTILDSGSYLVLCRDQVKFSAEFTQVTNMVGDFDFGLNNAGEALRIFDSGGVMMDVVVFDDAAPWPVASDGSGATLTLKSPGLDNSRPVNWGYSSSHGTPGAANADDVGIDDIQPLGFSLGQNYPNPFNPTTTIEFTLSESGFTELVIYNVMGQKMRTLVSTELPAGTKSILWDGKNDHGEEVSSGVYISRLFANGKTAARRMLLMK